jgi:hypothetical protein
LQPGSLQSGSAALADGLEIRKATRNADEERQLGNLARTLRKQGKKQIGKATYNHKKETLEHKPGKHTKATRVRNVN